MASDSATNGLVGQSMLPFATPQYRNEDVLLEPYSYLLQVPGKKIREKLAEGFNLWLKIDENITTGICKIVQMLHTASLLIDDIEDNSRLRRGIPAAHLVYGVPWTINCANYVYFRAMKECTALGNLQATQLFLDEMIKLHCGQGFDIYWRDTNTCPTEKQYEEMVMDKTGGLFRMAVGLMQSFSENKTTDYTKLASLMGLYFQIRDDYINLRSSDYHQKKDFCEDLTEGKFSFPIIHCITTQPHDRRLLNILKQRTSDPAMKEYAVEYMEATGSFAYTRNRLERLLEEIKDEMESLGGNPILTQVMKVLGELGDEHKPGEKESKAQGQHQTANHRAHAAANHHNHPEGPSTITGHHFDSFNDHTPTRDEHGHHGPSTRCRINGKPNMANIPTITSITSDADLPAVNSSTSQLIHEGKGKASIRLSTE